MTYTIILIVLKTGCRFTASGQLATGYLQCQSYWFYSYSNVCKSYWIN